MFYHNILHDDMLNGSGLRVVLFVSGCSHSCQGCQNPQTWNVNGGIPFDELAKEELFEELSKDYISGITFSGGDPLHPNNLNDIYQLILEIKEKFPTKTIWIYTGYTWEDILANDYIVDTEGNTTLRQAVVSLADVLVDGEFKKELADINYCWAGSTNQKVIDIKKSLKENKVVLYD